MTSVKILEKEIAVIKERNTRVETEKAWETSLTRKVIICILTYLVVVTFFYFAHLPNPLINSIVPSMAFIISSMSLPFAKGIWLRMKKEGR